MGKTENVIRAGLDARGIRYVFHGEHKGRAADELQRGLDFYLPDFGIYIECKDYHSDRIAGQMARAANVIAVQGEDAARFLCDRF